MPGVGYVGPARVWDRSQRYGLACSRSMGDTVYVSNRAGVISEPEVSSHRLSKKDQARAPSLTKHGGAPRASTPHPPPRSPSHTRARGPHEVLTRRQSPPPARAPTRRPCQVIIFGSDGVWDHISSQEAVAIASQAKTPQAASDRIAQVARERWRRNGPMQDDITAVVVGLN
jgi:serine/threonine protein phosphatase PrpC